MGLVERVNGELKLVMGPAMLGPLDGGRREHIGPCPLCGEPMNAHVIDRSTPDVVLLCPEGSVRLPEPQAPERLNEVGMPASASRRRRAD